jgi:hypothetical protein
MTLRRNVVQWIAPLALVVAFLLTFGTWIAAAPNGTRIYTQSGWQAAFTGGFDADPVGDRVMQAENDLKKNSGANVSLVLYLILLIPAAVIAVADRLLTDRWATIPDLFRTVWPRRHLVIAVLCAVLLLLLVMPLYFRVGLETAATATAEAAVTQTQSSAGKPEPTTTEKTERDIQRDIAVARFGLTRTTWLRLAVFVQFIALIGIGTTWWLDRHPSAPDPRVEVYC